MARIVIKQPNTAPIEANVPTMLVPTGRGPVPMPTVPLMSKDAAIAVLRQGDKVRGDAYSAICSLIAPHWYDVVHAADAFVANGDVKNAKRASSEMIGKILTDAGIKMGRGENGGALSASQYRSRIAGFAVGASAGVTYQVPTTDDQGRTVYVERELSLITEDGRAVPTKMLDTVNVEKTVDEVAQAHVTRARAVLKSAYASLYGDRLRSFWAAVESSEEYQTLMLAVEGDTRHLPADLETDAANNGTAEDAAA